jgi:hypothetical protein
MQRAVSITLFALAIALRSGIARAETALVVLVRPAAQSAVVTEALTRIRGELVADGFEVSVVDGAAGLAPAEVLARADQPASAAATLGLFVQADAGAAELWVVDRLTNKTVVRSVQMAQSSGATVPEVLARRSVELLRASLLEILVDTQKRAPTTPTPHAQASRWAERALEPRRSSFGIEAGALGLVGFGGIGAAILPVARVRAAFGERFGARLTLSGLGTRPQVVAAEGTATVSQELALAEFLADFAPSAVLRPHVSLGAGAYHIGVEGSAKWPYAGLLGDRVTFAADVGAGLALSLTSAFAVAIEGHALWLAHYPVIRFLHAETAETGRPLVSAALTLVGWL